MKKHFIRATALVVMLFTVCTMFASCFLLKATISLDKTEAALFVGDSIKLVATTSDEKAEVEWSTSNEKVATVRRGTVSAVGVGTAVITASLEGGASATCTITVSERSVTISQTTATINLDESNTLTLTASSSDGGEITWSSSDPAIATVVGGVVTAYDIGKVTITAQRGAATATCAIDVIEPSRPEDYYHITKLTNAEVVADPGVWHYHADGSMGGDYGFSKTPLHRDATASATLNVIPKVANSQYFYFRYQPNQVELNSYYTMSVTITVSEDCTLRIGSRRVNGTTFAPLNVDVKANEPKTVEYIGYLNEYEPFSVRINSELDAESVTLSVKINSVVPHDGKDLPEYHTKVEEKPKVNYEQLPTDESAYDLETKTNSETMSAPDKWHFNQGESSVVSSVKYNNGTITFDFETLQTTGNSQLRLRPTLDPNTKIKISFTVTSNVASKVVLALCDSTNFASSEWNEKRLTGTNSVTFEAEMTLKESQLIFIQVQALGETASNASFTFSDIKIYKAVEAAADEPIENGYYLESGFNSQVVANSDKWFYFCDGSEGVDYELAATPKLENGVLTLAFNKMTELNGAGQQPTYQLRYQPNLAVGTKYSVSFTLTLDADGFVNYGAGLSNSDYAVAELTAGTYTLTWEGYVLETMPFAINIRSNDRSAPITLTVSDIVFVEVEDGESGSDEPEDPTIENGYYLEPSNNSGVVANPGKWFYFGDGAEGTDFVLASKPNINNGVITYAFSAMTAGANYQLRYQPEFAVGTKYTATVTVTVDAACKILYSNEYKVHVFEEAGSVTLTWTGTVGTAPYMIQIKECTAPITISVSDISFVEYVEPEVPAHQCESICADCGKCTDAECTESACESKCEGHQTEEPELIASGEYVKFDGNEEYTINAGAEYSNIINVTYSEISTNTYKNINTWIADKSAGKATVNLIVKNNGTETVYITVKLETDGVGVHEGKLEVAPGKIATYTGNFSGIVNQLFLFIDSGWSNENTIHSGDITITGIQFTGDASVEPEEPEIPEEGIELKYDGNDCYIISPKGELTQGVNVSYSGVTTNSYQNVFALVSEASAGKTNLTLKIRNNGTETVYITVKLQTTDKVALVEQKVYVAAGETATVTGNFSGSADSLYFFIGTGWSNDTITSSGSITIYGIEFGGETQPETPVEPEIPAEGVELKYEGNTEYYTISPVGELTQGVNISYTNVTTNSYKNVYALISNAAAGKTNYTLKIRNNGTETVKITIKIQTEDKAQNVEKKMTIPAGETQVLTSDFNFVAYYLTFFIDTGWSAETTTHAGSVTIYGVEFGGEAVQPEPTPDPEQPEESVSYELTTSNNSGVIANPGKWFYSFDGSDGNEYDIVAVPKYENGTIVVEFIRMAEGSPTYQLRYQPELEVGANYSITFTVEVSAAGKVVYGNDYKAHEFTEAGSKTLTWTGAVDGTNKPFIIQIRSTDRSAPITMTVSNITITAN